MIDQVLEHTFVIIFIHSTYLKLFRKQVVGVGLQLGQMRLEMARFDRTEQRKIDKYSAKGIYWR